jgi:hypothetical protein
MSLPLLSSFFCFEKNLSFHSIWCGSQNDLLDSCELQFGAWSRLKIGIDFIYICIQLKFNIICNICPTSA